VGKQIDNGQQPQAAPVIRRVWRKSIGFDGNYVGLGSYTSRYDGRNNGSGTMLVYVSGGQSTVNKRVSGGDSCLNTWALSA